jgi:hypothetical protein
MVMMIFDVRVIVVSPFWGLLWWKDTQKESYCQEKFSSNFFLTYIFNLCIIPLNE